MVQASLPALFPSGRKSADPLHYLLALSAQVGWNPRNVPQSCCEFNSNDRITRTSLKAALRIHHLSLGDSTLGNKNHPLIGQFQALPPCFAISASPSLLGLIK